MVTDSNLSGLKQWTRFAKMPLMLTSAFQSSNSESSSSISSPEHAAGSCSSQCVVGPCSPLSSGEPSELAGPTHLVSYLQINRILKEAHFQSLHSRGKLRDTWWLNVPSSATRPLSPRRCRSTICWITSLSSSPPISSHRLYISVDGDQFLVRYLEGVHHSNKSKW